MKMPLASIRKEMKIFISSFTSTIKAISSPINGGSDHLAEAQQPKAKEKQTRFRKFPQTKTQWLQEQRGAPKMRRACQSPPPAWLGSLGTARHSGKLFSVFGSDPNLAGGFCPPLCLQDPR